MAGGARLAQQRAKMAADCAAQGGTLKQTGFTYTCVFPPPPVLSLDQIIKQQREAERLKREQEAIAAMKEYEAKKAEEARLAKIAQEQAALEAEKQLQAKIQEAEQQRQAALAEAAEKQRLAKIAQEQAIAAQEAERQRQMQLAIQAQELQKKREAEIMAQAAAQAMANASARSAIFASTPLDAILQKEEEAERQRKYHEEIANAQNQFIDRLTRERNALASELSEAQSQQALRQSELDRVRQERQEAMQYNDRLREEFNRLRPEREAKAKEEARALAAAGQLSQMMLNARFRSIEMCFNNSGIYANNTCNPPNIDPALARQNQLKAIELEEKERSIVASLDWGRADIEDKSKRLQELDNQQKQYLGIKEDALTKAQEQVSIFQRLKAEEIALRQSIEQERLQMLAKEKALAEAKAAAEAQEALRVAEAMRLKQEADARALQEAQAQAKLEADRKACADLGGVLVNGTCLIPSKPEATVPLNTLKPVPVTEVKAEEAKAVEKPKSRFPLIASVAAASALYFITRE